MSQISEFRRIAIEFGTASFRDHIKNYFKVTGRLADEVAIRSLSARVNKALRVDGSLNDLRDTTIKASETRGGKVSEWTIGLETHEDKLGDLVPAGSVELQPVIALLDETDKPAYLMPSSNGHIRTAIIRAAKESRIGQRELGSGYMAQEYERRLHALNGAAKDRELQLKDAALDRAHRLLELHLGGGGSTPALPRGNGRTVITTRRREDNPPAREDVN